MQYKEYVIENDGTYGMKFIKPGTKGSVHMPLRGTYTSYSQAMKAIDNFLANRSKDNGETNISGGSK